MMIPDAVRSPRHAAPLRKTASASRSRWGWGLALAIAAHLGIGVALWREPTPLLSSPARGGVTVQLTSMAPHAPAAAEQAHRAAVPPPRPKPSLPARHPGRRAPKRPTSVRGAATAAPAARPPSAARGDLLNRALADVHQQAWQHTSRQYADDTASGVQSALARYRQDWVRGVQQYIDLHFPDTQRDASLIFDVTISRDGQLRALDVIHSTGDAALDALAFKNLRAAAPFRAFDAAMGGRQAITFRQRWVFNQGALLEL